MSTKLEDGVYIHKELLSVGAVVDGRLYSFSIANQGLGHPGQTLSEWRDYIKAALELGVPFVSREDTEGYVPAIGYPTMGELYSAFYPEEGEEI